MDVQKGLTAVACSVMSRACALLCSLNLLFDLFSLSTCLSTQAKTNHTYSYLSTMMSWQQHLHFLIAHACPLWGWVITVVTHKTAKPGHACPQEQAASFASPSPEADNTSGEAAPHTHEQLQLQRDLAAAVKGEAEKTRDIQSLGMPGAYGRNMYITWGAPE